MNTPASAPLAVLRTITARNVAAGNVITEQPTLDALTTRRDAAQARVNDVAARISAWIQAHPGAGAPWPDEYVDLRMERSNAWDALDALERERLALYLSQGINRG